MALFCQDTADYCLTLLYALRMHLDMLQPVIVVLLSGFVAMWLCSYMCDYIE